MKNRSRHIIYARIVLICFLVGQIIAFSHQHKADLASHSSLTKNATSGQTVKEKCYVCDTMHHTYMAIFTNAVPQVHVITIDTPYSREHDYKGIALILSAGRSPP